MWRDGSREIYLVAFHGGGLRVDIGVDIASICGVVSSLGYAGSFGNAW